MNIEFTSEQKRTVTLALFGRTGAGKSSLANKITGQDHFLVGHGLISQTESVASEEFIWPFDPSLLVKIVDTPGFADNRPEMTNDVLLSKILDFLQNMKEGLNIALYCLPAKARIDQHDTQELEMLGLLLGNAFFDHACIVITQANAFTEEYRQKISENFKNDLSGIFEKNGLPAMTDDRILFADFDQLKEKFMQPLTYLIQTTPSYIPELSEDINPQDPKSIAKFLAKPEMQEVMNYYENMMAVKQQEMEGMQRRIVQQAEETQQLILTNQQRQKVLENDLENVRGELKSSNIQNEHRRKQLEEAEKRGEVALKSLKQQLSNLTEKNDSMQRMMEKKDNDISALHSKMIEIQNTRMEPQIIYRDRICNIF